MVLTVNYIHKPLRRLLIWIFVIYRTFYSFGSSIVTNRFVIQLGLRTPTFHTNVGAFLTQDLGVTSTESDVAYLDHCDLMDIDIDQYKIFREFVLTRVNVVQKKKKPPCCDGINNTAARLDVTVKDVFEEVTLQSLELFARASGRCDFSRYNPQIRDSVEPMEILEQKILRIPEPVDREEARLVFLISAFNDFPQLNALVESIYLPHHLIIIHLERRVEPELEQRTRALSQLYSNVIVIKYGTVVYPGDQLSQIFYSLMSWVTSTGFQYGYLITLGSSSFPLMHAKEMARYLKRDKPRVRLGTLYGGRPSLCNKRSRSLGVYFTRGNGKKERIVDELLSPFLANITLDPEAFFLPGLLHTCQAKTNSGLTAAYDREAVVKLTNSTKVKEHMSRFKQSGQCCVEESYWGDALHLIGRQSEISMPGLIWQAWRCNKHSSRNAYLKDPSIHKMCLWFCEATNNTAPLTLNSTHAIMESLRLGKQQGNLFARKFSSDDSYWMDWIKANLHESKESAYRR